MGGVGVRDCVIDSVCCWCIGMSVWGGGGHCMGYVWVGCSGARFIPAHSIVYRCKPNLRPCTACTSTPCLPPPGNKKLLCCSSAPTIRITSAVDQIQS